MPLPSLPSPYGLLPGELAERLGGSGRARAVWALIRAGRDPFTAPPSVAVARLHNTCAPSPMSVRDRLQASCGTVMLGIELADRRVVETVVIPQRSRTTVCVSSQVGCARGCIFCMTATMGLERSLDASEMVLQVALATAESGAIADTAPVRNVVFMGMGEPLDNLDATRRAISILTDPHGFALGPGHITLSTVGTTPAAITAAGEIPVRLAWSLHAVDDEVRRHLVPTARHPPGTLLQAFIEVLNRRRGTTLFIEVTLVADINDSVEHARAIAEFLRPITDRVRINLLPMNPGRPHLRPSPAERVAVFQQSLRDQGYFCLVRRPRGDATASACGQLVTGTASSSSSSSSSASSSPSPSASASPV